MIAPGTRVTYPYGSETFTGTVLAHGGQYAVLVSRDNPGETTPSPTAYVRREVQLTPVPQVNPSPGPIWVSGFERSPDWWMEWDRVNPTTWQPQFWPQADPIRPVLPSEVGIPASPGGGRIMRFSLVAADLASGNNHAKLFRTYNIGAAADGFPGLGGDVSGTYKVMAFWPAGRRIEFRPADAATGLLGFKEIARNRTIQDMMHVTSVRPREWINERPGKVWLRPDPGINGYPCVFVDHWTSENNSRRIAAIPVPEGRWFEVKCVIKDRVSATYTVDGVELHTILPAEYPPGPQYERAAGDQLALEIGNYGNALGVTYFDDASITRL